MKCQNKNCYKGKGKKRAIIKKGKEIYYKGKIVCCTDCVDDLKWLERGNQTKRHSFMGELAEKHGVKINN